MHSSLLMFTFMYQLLIRNALNQSVLDGTYITLAERVPVDTRVFTFDEFYGKLADGTEVLVTAPRIRMRGVAGNVVLDRMTGRYYRIEKWILIPLTDEDVLDANELVEYMRDLDRIRGELPKYLGEGGSLDNFWTDFVTAFFFSPDFNQWMNELALLNLTASDPVQRFLYSTFVDLQWKTE